MSSPWLRMDQLLKCSVCSDRYRNPKLLPCNHTFCAEPCLSRSVDKANKHQIKCPECSSEHRIPLQGGVQGFPNNVTLCRFLELRQQVSGREPELPASMQRCNTCQEKGQLEMCAHCNRKVCKECKTAHVNILRKEIALINGQVREGLQQLCNALHNTEENAQKLQKNYTQVKDEIEEVVRRYTRDLLDTETKLKHHLDVYLKTELRSMRRLEHDLQIELNNVNSNCDLVDKYVNNGVDWTDAELTDYKEIFQKTLEFLRAFDSDPTDCIRKVKFHPRSDPDVIHKTLIDFAEVKLNEEIVQNSNISETQQLQNGGMYSSSTNLSQGPSVTLTPPKTNALSRSQSDHKLCGQRQSQKRKDVEDTEPALSRRFRDRFMREERDSCERDIPNNRDHSPSSWRRELEEVRHPQKNRFSSREVIDENDDSDVPSRGVDGSPLRDHVSGTEDATKGPLSGVIRILDSPHVMERLHHSEVKQKRMKEEEERKAKMPPPAPPPVSRPMTRQLSEDEIEKQKKENKAAAAASASANAASSATAKSGTGTESSRTPKPVVKKEEEPTSRSPYTSKYTSSRTAAEESSKARSSAREEPSSTPSGRRTPREETQTPTPPPSRLRSWRTTSSAATERDASQSPPSSPTRGRDKPPLSPRAPPPASTRPVSRFLPKPSSLDKEDSPPADTTPPRRSNLSTATTAGRSSPLDRPKLRLTIPHHSPSSSETSSSSESESEEVDSETAVKRGDISPSVNTLLARSAQARKQSASTQARILNQPDEKLPRPSNRPWRDSLRKEEEPSRESISSRRKTSIHEPEERTKPYSHLFDRRRSSVTSGNTRTRDLSPEDNSYAARRNRIARSKSSHDLYPAEDSPEDDTLTAIRNRYRTRRAARDASPEEAVPHSWSQYMKNKYGSGGRPSTAGSGLIRSRTSASLVAPRSGSDNSSDEDTPPRRKTDYSSRRGDSNSPRGFSLPRRTYMQKGKSCFKFGTRGTDHGCFTWPRGVCVGNDNTIVVADSNNHRVQVFNSSGKFIQEFGAYGSSEGEFDCLAGVTVNRIGQFIVSDRYNHRLQVFDPNGRFIRAFGQEGRMEGKFSYPWGVATDNLGFIYVCDKENHRIQVFQGDGTYVTKFGGIGQRPGELEHPHYVAVSTTNRVIVSDSNNHRIQIFDVNGRLLSTFGTEGSEEGQFKYPRGVAVDDQGYLIVGDSGNNRIQIFHPDGTFLKAFGTWGSGDGEFKGLEGIAVSPTGQILACDRENHRIQVF